MRKNGLFLPRIRETEMGYNCKDMRTCWVIGMRECDPDDIFWFYNLNSKNNFDKFVESPTHVFINCDATKILLRMKAQIPELITDNLYNLWRK